MNDLIMAARTPVFIRYVCVLLLLLCGVRLEAKDLMVEQQIARVDSLVFYCNYAEAEKELERLTGLLADERGKEYRGYELMLMLSKTNIYRLQNEIPGNIGKALETALVIIDRAEEYGLPETAYQACLVAESCYEHTDTTKYDLCKKYLDRAYRLYRENSLEHVYSTYCVRMASYCRRLGKPDSAMLYAYRALDLAKTYGNKRDHIDACMLLGMGLMRTDVEGSAKYFLMAARAFMDMNDHDGAMSMYNNIANGYLRYGKIDKAFLYNDSALWLIKTYSLTGESAPFKTRYRIFDSLGNKDSSYAYFRQYHTAFADRVEYQLSAELVNIAGRYEHDKKEAIIKDKNRLIVFIVTILSVIAAASIFILRKNRKIRSQNKIITSQVEDLLDLVKQKQVLLSELQHRVKNNLQHVISILEIQKESVDFNNIDELIRGNQNRIHSMALLHKKLTVTDSVNDVDLERYVTELAELVKDSYHSDKKISLLVACEISTISVEKALPIGLIVVELVSNSMKHAFVKQDTGTMQLLLTRENDVDKNKLYYADSGVGYDFNIASEKGLGMEIVRGLIDQLDAVAESDQANGFQLTLWFN